MRIYMIKTKDKAVALQGNYFFYKSDHSGISDYRTDTKENALKRIKAVKTYWERYLATSIPSTFTPIAEDELKAISEAVVVAYDLVEVPC